MNLKIKDGQLPTCVCPKGRTKYDVYNADQLIDEKPLNDYIAKNFVDLKVRRTSTLPVHIREHATKIKLKDSRLGDIWIFDTMLDASNLFLPLKKRVIIYAKNRKFELLNISELRPFEYYRIVKGANHPQKSFKKMHTGLSQKLPATLDGLCFKPGHVQSFCSPDFVYTLSKFIAVNNLEHTNLLTSALIEKIGAQVRYNEKAFYMLHDQKEILIYTDDQLMDTKPFLQNLAWVLPQVSGYNGRHLPKYISDRLAQYTKNYAFFSRFWFSYKKAKEMDAMLPGAKFCITKNSENSKTMWINASQMKPFVMRICEKRLTNYEKYLRKMRSKVN